MATTRALLIPWDNSQPVQDVTWDTDSNDDVNGFIFGPEGAEKGFVDVKTFRHHRLQLVFDDMGIIKQPTHINDRAMQLYARLSGFQLADFEQPLVGNFLVIGLDPDSGETEDVPQNIRRWFGEEGVDQT